MAGVGRAESENMRLLNACLAIPDSQRRNVVVILAPICTGRGNPVAFVAIALRPRRIDKIDKTLDSRRPFVAAGMTTSIGFKGIIAATN